MEIHEVALRVMTFAEVFCVAKPRKKPTMNMTTV
jgi:hypothetical protein